MQIDSISAKEKLATGVRFCDQIVVTGFAKREKNSYIRSGKEINLTICREDRDLIFGGIVIHRENAKQQGNNYHEYTENLAVALGIAGR